VTAPHDHAASTLPMILARNRFMPDVEARLAKDWNIVYASGLQEDGPPDAGRVRGIATNSYSRADAAFLQRFPNVEIVSTMSVGTDHIDLDYARRQGIAVTNIAAVLNDCVADLGIGLIIGLLRGIFVGDRYIRRGGWQTAPLPLGRKIAGSTLGILGLGSIGTLIAQRAATLGMNVAYCNRSPVAGSPYEYCPDGVTLARRADVLLVIVPGMAANDNLVSSDVLAALGADGFLVNLARGSIVDDDALIKALRGGTIAGAALDVFRNEPNVRREYLDLDNVHLTPHIGSATAATRTAMGMAMADNLHAHFMGRPLLNPVV
jgi:lactate dehydrogenase-like 2-hydroxyacid dehydrogenase